MKHLFFLLLWGLSYFPCAAQISMKEILRTAKREKSMQRHQQQMDYIGKKSYEMPWLDGVEVRTETNNFNLQEQRFTLRVTTNSKAERKAERASQNSQNAWYSANEQILLSEFLQQRYGLIIELYFIQTFLRLKKISGKVHRDQIKVLQKSVNLSDFKINDLIKADDKLKENQRDIIELEEALKYGQEVVYGWTRSKNEIEIQDDFIPIDEVMKISRKLKLDNFSHVKLMKWTLDIDRSSRELDMMEAEGKKWIDFYQMKYGSSNSPELKSDISFGIGVTIPLKKSRQIKMSELKVEKLIKENNKAHLKEELEEQMKNILAQMETKYKLYNLIDDQIRNSQANFVYQKYKNIGGAPPLALLQLKESDFKKEFELFEIEKSIYQLYLELLVTSGRIAKAPFTNYLSKNLERY